MIFIISPSKSMDFTDNRKSFPSTNLSRSSKTMQILNDLKLFSKTDLQKTLKISDAISNLNYNRYQNFETLPQKQAILAYSGDVYRNINIDSLSEGSIKFAQNHLKILSALYGVVKPFDKIKAYRLEMGTRLPNIAEKNMAIFWQNHITDELTNELKKHKNKILVNIASNEYSASVDPKKLDAIMINIHFREIRNGNLRNIAINSKRARGMIASYAIENRIDKSDDLKSFNKSGYIFNKKMSNDNNFFFLKTESI